MPKVRSTENGTAILFQCPGCGNMHKVYIKESEYPHPVWGYNGNPDSPTITPTVLVKSGHYARPDKDTCWCKYNAENIAKGEDPSPYECVQCHSFVTAGKIHFLSDCTHKLVGQTVDLPEV